MIRKYPHYDRSLFQKVSSQIGNSFLFLFPKKISGRALCSTFHNSFWRFAHLLWAVGCMQIVHYVLFVFVSTARLKLIFLLCLDRIETDRIHYLMIFFSRYYLTLLLFSFILNFTNHFSYFQMLILKFPSCWRIISSLYLLWYHFIIILIIKLFHSYMKN